MKKIAVTIVVLALGTCVFLALRGVATKNVNAPYYLIYQEEGTDLKAYIQSQSGVVSRKYVNTMQSVADILGNDRTGDLHDIEEPNDSAGDVAFDLTNLKPNQDVIDQFLEQEKSLQSSINDSYEQSDESKQALLEQVDETLDRIKSGDITYLVPEESYLKLENVKYDKANETQIVSADIVNFYYKKTTNVTIRDGEADFSDKSMTSSMLWGKELSDIPLNGSRLCESVFAESNLSNGKLSDTNLYGAVFVNNNMQNCSLKNANLSGTTFIGDDLTGADLTDVLLCDTCFKKMGEQCVKIDSKWKDTIISSSGVSGTENIEWVN